MIKMGYYIIRQGEEYFIESPNHMLKVICDKDGDLKMIRTERRSTVWKKQIKTQDTQPLTSKK